MSIKKKQKYPIVEVQWLDSATTPGWQPELHKQMTVPLMCWTAGYLVHKDSVSLVVAQSCSSEDSKNAFGDVITIPTKTVVKYAVLRRGEI